MAEAQELRRISSLAQLEDLLAKSSDEPVWLFKHSLICPTSDEARARFESFVEGRPDRQATALIEIQAAREVSAEVERRTGVRHESPQVLLIRDGRPVWTASHWSITEAALGEALETHAGEAG